jgi:hypothetical protein
MIHFSLIHETDIKTFFSHLNIRGFRPPLGDWDFRKNVIEKLKKKKKKRYLCTLYICIRFKSLGRTCHFIQGRMRDETHRAAQGELTA